MKIHLFIFLLWVSFASAGQEWHTNFEEAKIKANQENKKIVLVFQGSDWCAPCIKLERQVWETKEFIHYASTHFVMVKADFPRRKKNKLDKGQQVHNEKLADKFNKKGAFPLVVVFDANGEVIGTAGYQNLTPSEYISMLESLKS